MKRAFQTDANAQTHLGEIGAMHGTPQSMSPCKSPGRKKQTCQKVKRLLKANQPQVTLPASLETASSVSKTT
eukprot:2574325-Amphidinium_carterae.2